MFSLHLGKKEDDVSKMVIGGYDEAVIERAGTKLSGPDDKSRYKTKDGIFWMDINSNVYW